LIGMFSRLCCIIFLSFHHGYVLILRNILGSSSVGHKSKLLSSKAVETNDAILSSFYEENLYEVLNIKSDATKLQVKEAYWSISARNHPDRNNTIESLAVFRNASHAYKILKDPKKRKEYDAKYKTEQFLENLEDVTEDIVKPFAQNVAIPFLNYTYQTVKRYGVPLVKEVYETSIIVAEEVVAAANDPSKGSKRGSYDLSDVASSSADFLTRTSYIVSTKRLKQSLQKLDKAIIDAEVCKSVLDTDLEQGNV
jgi:hypothetical protein